MRRLLAALGLGALLALLGAAPAAAARAGGPPAATVDGQAIPRERLERFVERYAAARGRSVGAVRSPSAYRILVREALQALVDEELLGQEAVRRGLSPPPAEVAAAVAGLQARHHYMNPGHAQCLHKSVKFQHRIRFDIFRRHVAITALKSIVLSRLFIESKVGRANHEDMGSGLATHK